MKKLFCILLFPLCVNGQIPDTLPVLYKNRTNLERTLINNVINKNLSLPVHDTTASKWNSAFFALQYLNKKSPWIEQRIRYAVSNMDKTGPVFQRNLLEIIYGQYPGIFTKEVAQLFNTSTESRVIAMCAHYLLKSDSAFLTEIQERVLVLKNANDNPWIDQLYYYTHQKTPEFASIVPLFEPNYLKGNVLMISIQRKNRDYPGLVLVRDKYGNFLKDSTGKYITVPQLARSLSGLPGYLTNGNTPEGIIRMDGYGISKAGAIGPTTNIQMSLPRELDARHFYKDSSRTDTIGTMADYKNLLPDALKNYFPIYEAYYAGWAGRYEIIAHGTTVKPVYYHTKPYYPFTPTLGCLCTYEAWDDQTGFRVESDQLKLVQAVEQAGGPDGYVIVINIDDQKMPVHFDELAPLLKLAGQE